MGETRESSNGVVDPLDILEIALGVDLMAGVPLMGGNLRTHVLLDLWVPET
jgi:hypothetical protein